MFISVGARVFARMTSGYYCRGFVTEVNTTTTTVKRDDGNSLTFLRNEKESLTLDTLQCYNQSSRYGQKVIGAWAGRASVYRRGEVENWRWYRSGSFDCYHKAHYAVRFDGEGAGMLVFYHIHLTP